MVSLGFGVGIVPDLVTTKSLIQSEVRILKVNPPIPPFDVGLCVRVRHLATPEVRAPGSWGRGKELPGGQ